MGAIEVEGDSERMNAAPEIWVEAEDLWAATKREYVQGLRTLIDSASERSL